MAVEFRCPDCRAKLRLATAPAPGEDVECSKCGTVFPAPGLAADGGDGDRPRKRPAADDAPPRPEKKKDEKKPAARKKKGKKKTTNPAVLAGVVVGGLVFIGLLTVLLVWYTRRQPAAVEMMYYLPTDCEVATGFNIGHVQKYEKLFETVDQAFADAPFRKAFGAVAKALGEEPKAIMDYAVTGIGKQPGSTAIVLRTKKEFDAGLLAKLPGAREATDDGVKYYKVDRIEGVNYDSPRVFAPTNRLVVVCPGDVPAAQFRGMLKGYKGNEKAMPERMGGLGGKVTRATYWVLYLYETGSKYRPTAPPKADGPGADDDKGYGQMVHGLAGSARGMGYKVNVGSRDMRFEWLIGYDDKERAQSEAKKWRESELAKGDEGDPPKWWKPFVARFGQKKVGEEMLSHLEFTSSGEVFIARTSVTTTVMMQSLSNLVSKSYQAQPGVDPSKVQPN